MTSMRAIVHRVPASGPNDVSGVEALFAAGLKPSDIVGILGKTEGNGCVNDFTRGYASKSFEDLFARHGVSGVSIVMSGGTEGALSPHWTVFARAELPDPPTRALAVGVAHTKPLLPEQIGTTAQIDSVAEAVRQAMTDAGIDDAADVHFVQIKCPLLTAARISEAEARGKATRVNDTLKSMGYSRGASALGVAVALEEIAAGAVSEADICANYALHSARASTSAGVELMGHEVIVLGMSDKWSGPLRIDHGVMSDAINLAAVNDARARLGEGRLVAVLAKAEADPSGLVRGRRHIMNDDSDIAATRHARAFVGGVLAGQFGMTDIYVSGGAEHQGPPGGGPVAIIIEKQDQ